MKILVIEDDTLIRDVIARGLQAERIYTVVTADNGTDGLKLGRDETLNAILLDVMLPGLDGWQICESLRKQRIATPIMMLTAYNTVEARVRGLEAGADDYLTKPFDFNELLARLHALIRRDRRSRSHVLHIGHLQIDTGMRQVRYADEDIALTPREFALLEALALNEGRVLSREAIHSHVWDSDGSASNTVDAYIRLLRKKIDANRPVKLIHTIHGQGYMLKSPSLQRQNS